MYFGGLLEAPLPLMLGGGLLGNGHVLSRALAGLAGSWEELPGSLVEMSTEFLCLGLGGNFGFGLAELKPTLWCSEFTFPYLWLYLSNGF